MSTILKALQKVEAQRLAQPAEGLSNSNSQLAPTETSGGSHRRLRRVGYILLFLICSGSAGGLWYVSRQAEDSRSTTGNASVMKLSTSEKNVEMAGKRDAAKDELQSLSRFGPIDEDKSSNVAKATIPVATSEETKLAPETEIETVTLPPKRRLERSLPKKKSAALPAPPSQTATPRIVVSGIAYQEDRAVRFAIVNDRALGEGEAIEGALVEEILEDRVRFSKTGTTFEVPLLQR